MKKDIKPLNYFPGLFDEFKNNPNLDDWCEHFPEIMLGLGFDLADTDCIDEAIAKYNLKLHEPTNRKEEYRNILYVLEHSNQKTIGDILFSYWRYFTHWTIYGYDKYDSDLCIRMLNLLEQSYLGYN